MASHVTVGFDIGGTNMRAGVVTETGEIIESYSTSVPRTAAELEAGIVAVVEKLKQHHDIAAVGLAIAGFLDPDCETVRFAPHLPWRDQNVRVDLSRALGLPVRLEHDANAAAWGEYRFGAARGANTWVLFAIGTGIGATLMHDGRIYRGAYGTAPEFGHIQVVPNGRVCPCGKKGCLERYCSGSALKTTATEFLQSHPDIDSVLRFSTFNGKDVMAAAGAGDELAQLVVAEFATWLGIGLSFVADILDPSLILIGGGVSADADLYLPAANNHMQANIVGAGHRPTPRVACAELGGTAGMIGVADLARELA